MPKSVKILSVGGSIIIPKKGFDIQFLKKFRSLILRHVKMGTRFVLVVGGGATCRMYQDAASRVRPMTDVDLDWLGIQTTVLNAEFVRQMFKEHAYKTVIQNPNHKVRTNKPIIVGAGYEPGHSTDTDAVLLAKAYGADHILNLSNIAYVYDKDPAKYKTAKKIVDIDWKKFRREVVGNAWTPGFNAPFDPKASRLAHRMNLSVSILKGTHLSEVDNALKGKQFRGTHIHS
jgi:uridylate kinase